MLSKYFNCANYIKGDLALVFDELVGFLERQRMQSTNFAS